MMSAEAFTCTPGVWPVMLTPFDGNGRIDYIALEALIRWYEDAGVSGLFAACLSSEIFALSLRERMELVHFIKTNASVPVIASGHVSRDPEDQLEELKHMAETNVDALVIISNRLADEGAYSGQWIENMEALLSRLDPSIPLGIYECPTPYKWLLSLEELQYCKDTGRFYFLKDTSCDEAVLKQRISLLGDSRFALFNAHTTTLLSSLRLGASGFSGIMANFHPELYVRLHSIWQNKPDDAETLQAALTLLSCLDMQSYPVNAKTYLQMRGLPVQEHSRVNNRRNLTEAHLLELKQAMHFTAWIDRSIE